MIKTEIEWYKVDEKEPPIDTLLVIIFKKLGTTMFITGVKFINEGKWKNHFMMENGAGGRTLFSAEDVLAWTQIDFLDVFK